MEKDPWNFQIYHFTPLQIPDKMKLHPWKFHKIVLHPLEFPRSKAKTHGIPHDFFWITPIRSTLWECMVIWVYIFNSLICNFIAIQHALLKYITIAARNPLSLIVLYNIFNNIQSTSNSFTAGFRFFPSGLCHSLAVMCQNQYKQNISSWT